MALFDTLQRAVFSTAKNVFGDSARWNGQESKVLYRSPNDPVQVGMDKYEYRPYNYSFEYYENDFIGLKKSVDMGNVEIVNVKGLELNVREVRAAFDGKTYIAYCEL